MKRTNVDLSHYNSREVEKLREEIKEMFSNPSDSYLCDRMIRELNEQWESELERRRKQAHRATNEFLFAGMGEMRA